MAVAKGKSWPEQLAGLDDPKVRNWYSIAMDYASSRNSFWVIKAGSIQHQMWVAYFDRLGWIPVTLRLIEQSRHRLWTAPCEWPDSLPMAEQREAS